jgi:hypothetical protein
MTTTTLTPFADIAVNVYPQYTLAGRSGGILFFFSSVYNYQAGFLNLAYSTLGFFLILSYKYFFVSVLPLFLFFRELPVHMLYVDYVDFLFSNSAALIYSGTYLSSISTATTWLFELTYSADLLLIAVECFCLVFLLNYVTKVSQLFTNPRIFYDDLVTFCKLNNVSLAEVGVFFSFFLGFIVFDIFICSVDEDVTDVFSYFMVTFVVLLFFFLILGIDVQYYYMVSSVSSGDLTLRVILFDVINNFLCILRIFFCWVRYIFYDLQVELVDFSFHYTDSINDMSSLALYDNAVSSAWFGDIFTVNSDSSLLSVTRASFWLFSYIYVDICFVILQMLLGFVKLFIAFFLLWLIVDLFILKAFAHSESSYLATLRNRR